MPPPTFPAMSDYVSIVVAAVSALFGAFVSWLFFRAQLVIDVKGLTGSVNVTGSKVEETKVTATRIEGRLSETQREITSLSESIRLLHKLDRFEDIVSIREGVQRIEQRLHEVLEHIASEIRSRQRALADTFRKVFEEQALDADAVLERAIRGEVSKVVRDSARANELTASLLRVVSEAIQKMSAYQEANLRQQSDQLVTAFRQDLDHAMSSVFAEAREVRETLDNLPAAVEREDGVDRRRDSRR